MCDLANSRKAEWTLLAIPETRMKTKSGKKTAIAGMLEDATAAMAHDHWVLEMTLSEVDESIFCEVLSHYFMATLDAMKARSTKFDTLASMSKRELREYLDAAKAAQACSVCADDSP